MAEQIEPEPTAANNGVAMAIHLARKAVNGYIKKDSTVKQGGSYRAVSHDLVTAHCRAAMIEHGLFIVPSLVSGQVHQTGMATSGGTPIFRYESVFDISIAHAPSGTHMIMRIPAHANDTGDKAPGKALSYATKYALLKLFAIESGEDDESRVEGAPMLVSEQQVLDMDALLEEVGADKAAFMKWAKVKSLDEILAKNYPSVIKMIEQKRKK